MNEINQSRIDEFLLTLKNALGSRSPGKQAEGVVEEVSADLHAHIGHHISEGRSEDEAVEKALDEMGNPYELAHHVGREIPPFGGPAATVIRSVAASATILWTLLLMWELRAWSYGFSGFSSLLFIFFLHLPFILLLWPRIVWRRNWLFGLIPAGIAFLVALFMSFGSVCTTRTGVVSIPQNGEEFVQELPAVPEEASYAIFYLVFAAAVVIALILLFAMQQKSQRRIMLLALLFPALFEAAYQWEEHLFRKDRNKAIEYFETTFARTGSYPTGEDFESDLPHLRGHYSCLGGSNNHLGIMWNRPLNSGFSLMYSSSDDKIWVQD